MPVMLKRTLVVRPIGGMNTFDPAQDIPNGASPDMLNFQVYNGYIRKRPGYAKYQSGSAFPAGPIMGIFSAQQITGARSLYAVNTTQIYKYNPATTNWVAQTGGPLTGGSGDYFSFEVSQNNLVFCQGVDNIQALDLTGVAYGAINANAKPSKYLSRWNLRLYAAFTVEAGVNKPFRVRWPVANDHTDWVGIGSGFNDLQDDVYQMRGILKLLDTLCVYTEGGILVATKTGNAAGPAQFQLQVKDLGLFCARTLKGLNTVHFLVGTDNIYGFNAVQLVPLADSVRNTIFNTLNPQALNGAFATLLFDSQEYAAFLPFNNNTAPDTAWVYNWQRKVMYPWQFTGSNFTCAALHRTDTSVRIVDLVGTIAAQTFEIGSQVLTANYPIVVIGDVDGHVHLLSTNYLSDDGAAITCRWTSKDYTAADIDPSLAGKMLTINKVGFSYIDSGGPCTYAFSFSIDKGASWIGPVNVVVGGVSPGLISDASAAKMVTGKRVRFKVENVSTMELPQLQAFYPELEMQQQGIA